MNKKVIHPAIIILLYVVFLAGATAAVIYYQLPATLLLLMAAPPAMAAFLYSRYVGIVMTLFWIGSWFTVYSFIPLDIHQISAAGSGLALIILISEAIYRMNKSRQKVAGALVESELKFRRFFEHSEDGIALVNENGDVIEWNRGLEQISGLKKPEVLNKPYWEAAFRMLPEKEKNRASMQRLKSAYQEFARSGKLPWLNQVVEHELLRHNEQICHVQEMTFAIKTDQGYMAGLVIRDMTEKKSSEETLRVINENLTQRIAELRQRNSEANLLNEMGDLLQSCLAVEDAYAVVGQFAEKLFSRYSGVFYVLNNQGRVFEAVASWGNLNPTLEPSFTPESCWTLRRGRTHRVGDPSNRLFCQHLGIPKESGIITSGGNNGNGHTPSPSCPFFPYLCVPMTAQGETLGILHLQAAPEQAMDHCEQLAENVAVRIALALANIKLRESLRMQSIRDPLTGLFNRRYMEETLERELHRAARHQLPLGVLMLDIDHFKMFNDKFGHEAGDAVLRELGTFLQSNVRGYDVACRYGGEEFILILPESTYQDTIKRATQIREGINGLRVQYLGQSLGSITVSQGVAVFPENGASAGQLLRAVDAALYRAKRAGRDRIMIAEK